MIKLLDIAKTINAEIFNPFNLDEDLVIKGVAPLHRAKKNELGFFFEYKFIKELTTSKAGAVILKEKSPQIKTIQLIHSNPQEGIALASQLFFKYTHSQKGLNEKAFIHSTAKLHGDVTVFPFAYIDEEAQIGDGTIIYPHTYIGKKTIVKEGCIIFPGVVIMDKSEIQKNVIIHPNTVIGSDGFGFSLGKKNYKIPQLGKVVIEEDVEIGSLSNIDRGTFDETRIGENTKIDSLVQIGHNVRVGKSSILCGQVGIAGSSQLGEKVIAAGQVGISQGINITDNVVLGAKCGATQDIKKPGQQNGWPNKDTKAWRKETIALSKLPDLIKTVRKLEKRIKEIDVNN